MNSLFYYHIYPESSGTENFPKLVIFLLMKICQMHVRPTWLIRLLTASYVRINAGMIKYLLINQTGGLKTKTWHPTRPM